MTTPLEPWSASAPNLVEHADNPIHTDAGAIEAGYPAAIVAGTTVYALMTHPPAAAWGLDWVTGGGCEVRFLDAVLADEVVDCHVTDTGEGGRWSVEAMARGEARARLDVWPDAPVPEPRDGEALEPLVVTLDDVWAGYGQRSGDDLELYGEHGLVHPAAWPCLANRIFKDQLVHGSWIHTRSLIAHHGAVPRGADAVIRSTVVDRFETRAGRRAVVDCVVEVDDQPVCFIEHEALVELF